MSTRRYSFIHRTRCPACHSTELQVEYASSFGSGPIAAFIRRYYKIDPATFEDGAYELIRCCDCGLLFQGWIGDDRLLSELYGQWINDANVPSEDPQYQRIMSRPLQSRDAHEIMAASSFLNVPTKHMVTLDYGMGWAMWARIARELGCRSFGSELSPDRVAFAKAHAIEVLQDDEIGTQEFHFINTEQVFEHLADPRGAAERLASALRPGGILKISVPSAEHVDSLLARLNDDARVPTDEELMPVQPLEHVNSFSMHSLERLADALRLSVVRPSLRDRYTFLKRAGTISLARPANTAKELIRPFHQYLNRRNLYVWMQKKGGR